MNLNELKEAVRVLQSDPMEAIRKNDEIIDRDADMLASGKPAKINYNIEYGVKYVTPIEAKLSYMESVHDSLMAKHNKEGVK